MLNAKEILERYRQGTATPNEQEWIEQWWLTYRTDEAEYMDPETESELSLSLKEGMSRMTTTRSSRYRWIPYAAAFFVALMGTLWFYRPDVGNQQLVSDIKPGGYRATLTYDDGSVIDLSDQQQGIIVGKELTYLDGTTVYEQNGRTDVLVLKTPKGGTYQAILPDGTHVWLNAASTLRYPARFESDERVVYLEGEAFFEVNKQYLNDDPVPFVVRTNEQTVRVRGTSFNISAYGDDLLTKTTLETGIVEVQDLKNNMTKRLKPGQQSRIDQAKFDIVQVDVDTEIGWKNGYFSFDRSSIDDVLKQFSRWYGVDFIYTGKKEGVKLSGNIHRSVSADKALSMLDYFNLKYIIKESEGDSVHVLIEDN